MAGDDASLAASALIKIYLKGILLVGEGFCQGNQLFVMLCPHRFLVGNGIGVPG